MRQNWKHASKGGRSGSMWLATPASVAEVGDGHAA
jgi:hypothetical protein